MTVLSPHEVAHLVIAAGFSTTAIPPGLPVGSVDSEATVFVAICCAESGCDTDAIGRSATGASVGNRDHGIGQVSGRWHSDKIRAAARGWRDPTTNIGICYKIFTSAGRKFTPWHVFSSGSYLTYLPDARIAVANPWPYRP